MKKLLFTLVAAFLLALNIADRAPAAVGDMTLSKEAEKAIVEKWGKDYKIVVEQDRSYNGVRAYSVAVDTKEGHRTGTLTENGEWIWAQIAGDVSRMPAPMASVVHGLFGDKVDNIVVIDRYTYIVDLDLGKKHYRLDIDAIGQINDLQTASQMRAAEDAVSDMTPATKEETEKLTPRITEYFKKADVKSIYEYPDAAGFFLVNLTADNDGKHIQIVMDGGSDVDHWSKEIPQTDLPIGVQGILSTTFKDWTVTGCHRLTQNIYNVTGNSGDNTITIQVTPTGDILKVRNAAAEMQYFAEKKKM